MKGKQFGQEIPVLGGGEKISAHIGSESESTSSQTPGHR